MAHLFRRLRPHSTLPQAFTSKACKLLELGLSVLTHQQRQAQASKIAAATLIASFARSWACRLRYREHMYRAKVAAEIVQTERSYMRALKVALSVFRTAAERYLPVADVNVLFGNMEKLRELNVKFWRDLETRTRHWSVETCVGDLFRSGLRTVLSEYLVYVQGVDAALKLHDKLLLAKGSRDYARAMEECTEDESAQGLQLGAYLILPVQRFPRYQLLLRDLLKHTRPTHPDHAAIDAALQEVVSMCTAINEATRHSDRFEALQRMERMLEGAPGLRLTDKPNRMLKAEVEVQELVLKNASGTAAPLHASGAGRYVDRTILVFDDMMVCVKKQSNKEQGWHVEWVAPGAAVHVSNPDPQATTLELVEYRRTKEAPFSEPVMHMLRPVDASHSLNFWLDCVRQYQANVCTPALMSDTHQWLTTNLISRTEWDLFGLAGKARRIDKGDTVAAAGSRVTQLHVVTSGKLAVAAPMGKHVLVHVGDMDVGAFFGVESWLRNPTYPLEVRAKEDSSLTSITFGNLASLLAANPHLCHRFWLLVCVTLAEQYHAWELPRAIDKHYTALLGSHPDSHQRETLESVFAPEATATRVSTASPTSDVATPYDEKVCVLLGLEARPIRHTFEDARLALPSKMRTMRGTLWVFDLHVAFHTRVLGFMHTVVAPYSAFLKLAMDELDSKRIILVYTDVGSDKPLTVYFSFDEGMLSRKMALDAMSAGLARHKRSLLAAMSVGAGADRRANASTVARGGSGGTGGATESPLMRTSGAVVAAAVRPPAPGSPPPQSPNPARTAVVPTCFRDSRLELTEPQWELVFSRCAAQRTYQANECIVEEGKTGARIFQLLSGRCRLETEADVMQGGVMTRTRCKVGSLVPGDIFGEQMYLFGGSSPVSVVADADNTEAQVLDRSALERLFATNPEIAGPFYKALAEILEVRNFDRNDAVLRNYSALLVRKLKSGELSLDRFTASSSVPQKAPPKPVPVAAPAPAAPVAGMTARLAAAVKPKSKVAERVMRPIVRKESLGQIARSAEVSGLPMTSPASKKGK